MSFRRGRGVHQSIGETFLTGFCGFQRAHHGETCQKSLARGGTVWDLFDTWNNNGLLANDEHFAPARIDVGNVDFDLWCVRAHRAASGGGKKGIRRRRMITHPLHFHLTAGQSYESTAFDELMTTAGAEIVDVDGELVTWPVAGG